MRVRVRVRVRGRVRVRVKNRVRARVRDRARVRARTSSSAATIGPMFLSIPMRTLTLTRACGRSVRYTGVRVASRRRRALMRVRVIVRARITPIRRTM